MMPATEVLPEPVPGESKEAFAVLDIHFMMRDRCYSAAAQLELAGVRTDVAFACKLIALDRSSRYEPRSALLSRRVFSVSAQSVYRLYRAGGPMDRRLRGNPEAIRCVNGPELTSRHFLNWRGERRIPKPLWEN
jgi:hypothetical protein